MSRKSTPAVLRQGPGRVKLASRASGIDHPGMQIRDAVLGDAPAACQVMRRSIAELCHADHRDDPAILGRWLSNKTPQHFAAWLSRPDNTVLVAVADGAILGVGAVTDAGEITLNYVSPDARFRGVSRTMVAALETRAAACGNRQVRLHSTATAYRFYLGVGYRPDGPPAGHFGSQSGHPMVKTLHDKDMTDAG